MRCIGNRRSFGQHVYDPASNGNADGHLHHDHSKGVSHNVDPVLNKDRFTIEQEPLHSPEHYFAHADYYFNSLESKFHWHRPKYAKDVIRWEWTPWLMLTAMGRSNIIAIDSLIRLCPCIVTNRCYRYFPQQPYVRALVTVYYGDEVIRRGQPLRIYEEFTFNDVGEISFIEAWWAREGDQLPLLDSDGWPVEHTFTRLSTRLPGLGSSPLGAMDLDSKMMVQVARQDAEVMDFRKRCKKFYSSVVQEMVYDILKNRESILGMRIRKRTNSFLFRTNSFQASSSSSSSSSAYSSPSVSSRTVSSRMNGRRRERGVMVQNTVVDEEDNDNDYIEVTERITIGARVMVRSRRIERTSSIEEGKWDGNNTDTYAVEDEKRNEVEEDDLCTYRFDEYFGDYLPIKPTEG